MAATVAAEQPTTVVRCAKAHFAERVATKRFDGEWTCYYGRWFRFDNTATCGGEEVPEERKMTAIRAFKTKENETIMAQQNVYMKPWSPNGKPRPQDAHLEVRFEYNIALDTASKVPYNTISHNRKDPQLLLALGSYDTENTASLPMWMAVGRDEALPIHPHLKGFEHSLALFAPFELFISDGPDRWALLMVYDKEGAPPKAVILNRERAVRLNPDEPDVLIKHQEDLPPIRPNLEADPQLWVPPTARQGVLHAIAVDKATGDLVYLPPTPHTFCPPSTTDTDSHSFMLLPDASYCILPKVRNWEASASKGCWAEFGVRTVENGCFRIMRFEYEPNGTLKLLQMEEY